MTNTDSLQDIASTQVGTIVEQQNEEENDDRVVNKDDEPDIEDAVRDGARADVAETTESNSH